MNTLIVSGGDINAQNIEKYVYDCQIIIAVDRGLEILYNLKMVPHYVVGDFDSINKEVLKFYQENSRVVFKKFNPEKDYTDTDIALKLAIELKSSKIIILGALGKRMDHALANIHILKDALDAKIPCCILDDNNKIYLVNHNAELYKNQVFGKYVSLFPLTSRVEGLTLKGFKYLLHDYSLTIGKSLGVSNEVIDDIAKIQLKKGILIVIESKD